MKKSGRGVLCLWLLVLVFSLAGCGQKTQQLTLFYTSDTHGRLADAGDVIGIDTIAAVHRGSEGSLLVDGGDFVSGNPIVSLSEGKNAVTLMKMAGYFAAAAGNHEFDFGQEVLLARDAEARSKPNPMHILSANVFKSDGAPLLQTAVTTTRNGLKIGFFGLTTREASVKTHPKNVVGLTLAELIPTAKTMAAQLRAQGCDLVVALVHVGTVDVMEVKSTDIADQVTGIDVIVDGHSHAVVDYTAPNGTRVVSSGAHAQHLGKLVLQKAPAGWQKTNTLLQKQDLAAITPASDVRAKLAELQQEQTAQLAEVIGKTDVDLEAERVIIRSQETNFGMLCADALLYISKADLAIINGGGIRASIKKGPITKGDIVAALPFSDALIVKTVTGAQLKEILEYGFKRTPMEDGGFPQISGMRVVVDLTKPQGQRVVSLTLPNGKPIAMQGRYALAVSDFLAQGGDGYPVLAKLSIDTIFPAPGSALTTYLREKGPDVFKPLDKPRIILRGVQKKAALPGASGWVYGNAG